MGARSKGIERLDWVDMAKGISIILVVMMYSAYSVGEDTGGIGFLHYIIAFATPFRMPEFFLISGLFLSQVIARSWTHYADRRVVHYLYFYALWAIIHIAFKVGIATGDPGGALSQMASALVQPYGVLWFVYVLAMFSAATKLLADLKTPHWLAFAAGAVLQIAPVATGLYAIDQFAEYFVYFYSGYMLAPAIFKFVASAMKQPVMAVAFLGLWAAIDAWLVFLPDAVIQPVHFQMGYASLPGVHLVMAIAGALALCTLAGLLTRLPFMRWLSWLGARSLIVYLAFALPMSMVRIVMIRFGLADNANLTSLAVFTAALVSPLVLKLLIDRTGFGKFLFERPAWAHIPGAPGSLRQVRRRQRAPAE